jgi:hypothetical protein
VIFGFVGPDLDLAVLLVQQFSVSHIVLLFLEVRFLCLNGQKGLFIVSSILVQVEVINFGVVVLT